MRLRVDKSILVVLLIALVGCAPPPPAPEGVSPETPPTTATPEVPAVNMAGIDLYLSRKEGRPGEERKPELWLHASDFTRRGDGRWELKGVKAHVYDENDVESLFFEAQEGFFDQEASAARLSGGVRARAAELNITMESMNWQTAHDGEPAFAEGTGDCLVEKAGLRLETAGIKLFPAMNRFEVIQMRGTIALGSMEP